MISIPVPNTTFLEIPHTSGELLSFVNSFYCFLESFVLHCYAIDYLSFNLFYENHIFIVIAHIVYRLNYTVNCTLLDKKKTNPCLYTTEAGIVIYAQAIVLT